MQVGGSCLTPVNPFKLAYRHFHLGTCARASSFVGLIGACAASSIACFHKPKSSYQIRPFLAMTRSLEVGRSSNCRSDRDRGQSRTSLFLSLPFASCTCIICRGRLKAWSCGTCHQLLRHLYGLGTALIVEKAPRHTTRHVVLYFVSSRCVSS